MTQLAILLLIIGIEGILLKVDDRMIFFLAGFGLVIYGFTLWTTYGYLSLIAVLAGMYNTSRGIWA